MWVIIITYWKSSIILYCHLHKVNTQVISYYIITLGHHRTHCTCCMHQSVLCCRVVQPGERLEWIQRVQGGRPLDASQAPAKLQACHCPVLSIMTVCAPVIFVSEQGGCKSVVAYRVAMYRASICPVRSLTHPCTSRSVAHLWWNTIYLQLKSISNTNSLPCTIPVPCPPHTVENYTSDDTNN